MSRIGKLPVAVPAGVNIDLAELLVTVKGPKGELRQPILEHVTVKIDGGAAYSFSGVTEVLGF